MKPTNKIILCTALVLVVFGGLATLNYLSSEPTTPGQVETVQLLSTASSEIGINVNSNVPQRASTDISINVIGEKE